MPCSTFIDSLVRIGCSAGLRPGRYGWCADSEAQIAALFDPPTDRRELVRYYTLSEAEQERRRCRFSTRCSIPYRQGRLPRHNEWP